MTTIEKKDFKPCPFCGSAELSIELRGVWKDNDCYCNKCGASIRCRDSPKELADSWNSRAALEAEKPAEDAVRIAEYLFNLEYPNTPKSWILSSATIIQQYAEAYHERKMKESASPFVPRSFEDEAERNHLRKCAECKEKQWELK